MVAPGISEHTDYVFFWLSKCFETGDLADVEISVESCHFPRVKGTFKAHKMILAAQNDVFRAMFYGDFAKEDRIVITDLHPEGVHSLLRYFYSGRLEVKTVHEAACTRTAAHKYLVPQLEEECLKFMNCGMTPDDVCPFLDYVLTVSEEALATHATIVIVRDSLKVLSSTTFKSSTEATVKYVLKHVTNVSEALVLQAAYAWGRHCLTLMKKARAPKRGRLGDHEKGKLRTILEPLFPQLRFLALTPKEFTDDPNRWGILTDAEARAILSNIVAEGSMPMPAGFCKIRQARA
ncbi:BTB/POZ domain-containing protein 6-B [Rhipicephalus sanguineus]|uniref:BTB/POZ domain-containing protein 6-B n=1 Tax=Rhipicephalus sanguineus TaxID=34632 RepID=UPI0020C47F09|nr:BTB/POZ domain-containing protein 6-B [Rhipicephalus sanguineus]